MNTNTTPTDWIRTADLKAGDRIVRLNGATGTIDSIVYKGLRHGHVATFTDGTTDPIVGNKVRLAVTR